MVDNSIFKEVGRKASIIDVISYYLGNNSIIKKGKDYFCLCPFHNDHNPSMRINVSSNTFKCYVDGTGGDAIKFVSEYEKIKPIEALKKVCQICSIPLPNEMLTIKKSSFEIEFKDELNALNELMSFYKVYLKSNEGKICRDYLEKRKIDPFSIDHFNLGYAPSDPSLSIKILREKGYSISCLEKSGILSNSSELLDRFSSRLMYPIMDNYGHLVGFSGRKIDENQVGGKYINYPATQLFDKGTILYHYNEAKKIAKKCGYVYVVEGFNDAIAFHRAGIDSVVATMGTALTDNNIKALKNLSCEIRLCLDRDEAGQKATENTIPLLYKSGLNFRIVRPFKGGKDADEILANYYPNGYERLKEEIQTLYDATLFLLARELKAKHTKSLDDAKDINSYLEKIKPYFEALDDVSKTKDVETIAKVCNLDKSVVLSMLNSKEENTSPYIKTYYPKKKDFEEYRRNRQYNRRSDIVKDISLPSQYTFADQVKSLMNLASNTPLGRNINKTLLDCETQIIYMLTHNKDAYRQFEDSRVNIIFQPYNVLSLLIGQIYITKPNINSFFEEDYQAMLKFVKQYPIKHKENKKKEVVDDLGFDIDDDSAINPFDDIYNIDIHPDDLNFLNKAIISIKHCPDSFYGKDEMERMLKIHPILLKYVNREKVCREEMISVSNDVEIRKIIIQLKKLNVKTNNL